VGEGVGSALLPPPPPQKKIEAKVACFNDKFVVLVELSAERGEALGLFPACVRDSTRETGR
jgi:hypothetical protein